MQTNKTLTNQQRSDVEAFVALPDETRKQLLAYAQGLMANPNASKHHTAKEGSKG